MTEKQKLASALLNLEDSVELDAMSVVNDFEKIFTSVIKENPKIAFFLENIDNELVMDACPKLVLKFTYKNRDVHPKDVHVINDEAEIVSLLCQHIGNYKTRFAVFVDGAVNINEGLNKFEHRFAAFFPNFLSLRAPCYKMPMIDMPLFDFSIDYRIGKVKLKMMEIEVDEAAEKIGKTLFLPGMDDATKAFLAHNYLAYTITYTNNEKASDLERSYLQSAYGALITKKCVCQGYAEAYKRLMDYAGIPCDLVCGEVLGSERDAYHAWNIIRLGGGKECYHVDVTWDSPGGYVTYDYFGVADSVFEGERVWNRKYNARCNSTKKLLLEGRRGIMRYKPQLLANGVSPKILGY